MESRMDGFRSKQVRHDHLVAIEKNNVIQQRILRHLKMHRVKTQAALSLVCEDILTIGFVVGTGWCCAFFCTSGKT